MIVNFENNDDDDDDIKTSHSLNQVITSAFGTMFWQTISRLSLSSG